ncbi:MAG: 4-alpha-glucanotransferase [Phycisphaerales bacterium]
MPATTTTRRALERLAKAVGVQTTYQSGLTGKTPASDDALVAMIDALGRPIASPDGADDALAALLADRRARRLDPVAIAWNGRNATARLRLPTTRSGPPRTTGRVRTSLALESGDTLERSVKAADLEVKPTRDPDGETAHVALVPLAPDERLPTGYHALTLEHAGETYEATVISAPRVSYQEGDRRLGVFCPTYALRSDDNAGVGNLTDLARLGSWAAMRGAPVVGTLPLLACFMEDSALFTTSPYSPVTRLFFNEVFLDPRTQPELAHAPKARRRLASPAFERAAAALRAQKDRVDYRASYDLLRPIFDELADAFFASDAAESYAFEAFLRDNPRAERYARFRATCEARAEPWTRWPKRMRSGTLRKGDYDGRARRTHLWAQHAMTQALGQLNDSLGRAHGGLYLDLAVGAHPDGFDTWDEQGLFVAGTNVGSPPDPTYTSGQDWGFPPMHPDRAREQGYRYFIDSLRAQMRICNVLRLDHVMAMHRLYIVPPGLPATDGCYIRYRAEELFAVLSVESHRNKCRLFGENLGTVPVEIERAMTKHRVGKMHVGQNTFSDDPKRAFGPVADNCVASLNTHDMPMLATHFAGTDLNKRVRAGVYHKDKVPGDRAWRKKTRKPVTDFLRDNGFLDGRGEADITDLALGLNRYLAASEAELVLVNIEDLWGETRMQNMPGTTDQHPNWQHKLRKTLRAIERDQGLAGAIEELATLRSKRAKAVTKVKKKAKKRGKKKTKK